MELRALFGGAITAPIKPTFIDASQFRQIPDNQEVFLDMQTQQSLIVELLEAVNVQDVDIARYHFEQVASDNEAAEYKVNSVQRVSAGTATPCLPVDSTSVYMLQGTQRVAKFNEANTASYNVVDIWLAVVRLASVDTDLVITINAPVAVAPGSSESADAPPVELTVVEQELMGLLHRLTIKNWNLFG
ncbi:hypothetical protein DFQ28_011636 [Apophysomyces sp. BC1034]|nr:hypothetical protein DFQ30_008507 [Apophysomyces sp. BC1015]KAG0178605.1 hypothetical protein DFQ29_003238 [Apophysomyces sp. BC1021]KAG0191519.1 hypothetical protein DFQ28_011636 [Apophysomyces sp. BC1034]